MRRYRLLILVPAVMAVLNFGLAALAVAGGGGGPYGPCLPGPFGCP